MGSEIPADELSLTGSSQCGEKMAESDEIATRELTGVDVPLFWPMLAAARMAKQGWIFTPKPQVPGRRSKNSASEEARAGHGQSDYARSQDHDFS